MNLILGQTIKLKKINDEHYNREINPTKNALGLRGVVIKQFATDPNAYHVRLETGETVGLYIDEISLD